MSRCDTADGLAAKAVRMAMPTEDSSRFMAITVPIHACATIACATVACIKRGSARCEALTMAPTGTASEDCVVKTVKFRTGASGVCEWNLTREGDLEMNS